MKAILVHHTKTTDELGNTVEIKMWQVPISPDKPHGFKYSLVYIVRGERVIGYDNGEGKGDHRHFGDKEMAYRFTDLQTLATDFIKDLAEYKKELT